MNWKPLLIGFSAGCLAASVAVRVTPTRESAYVLHFLEVRTLDVDTRLPVWVGVKFPVHPDFTYATAEPDRPLLSRVDHGGDSGITRVAWLGTASSSAYRFTLFADGYEDLVVPADFIKTTVGVSSGNLGPPATLLMKRAAEGADDQTRSRAE